MAVTFTGSVKTPIIWGLNATTQNLFTIENAINSRVNINIRRLFLQNDVIAALTTVLPLIKVSRATNISGGIIIEKVGFDTNQTSDAGVAFRSQNNESARITATAGDVAWQQFISRPHTLVEQQYAADRNLLPLQVSKSGREWKLRPGQSLLCQLQASVAAANSSLNNACMLSCVWEEDAITQFNISGNVTLGGTGIVGAKVIVMEATDRSMANAVLREVVTTTSGGAWSSTIRSGWVGAAFVQYETGGTLYTAAGSPFLESA